jgi:hypothetical protein
MPDPRPIRRKHRRPNRAGVAVIVVLGLLTITLALSYALLRTQGTATLIARNSSRQLDAKLAAEAGLAAALRKMHEDNWSGVTSTLSATVDANSSYFVEFATGDAALTPTDPNYSEYPFRVTITSTGTATDPQQPALQTTYRLQAVVQLIRRAFRTSNPANWNNYLQSTVYQWSTSDAHVNFPVRIEGRSTFLGRLRLCTNYPGTLATRDRYLSDLNLLRIWNGVDNRPFSGPITLGSTSQTNDVLSSLTGSLGLTVTTASASTSAPVTRPGSVTSYRLYPGGASYAIPSLNTTYGSTLSNVTLTADPKTNPLGVYRSDGLLTLGNNVSLTGVLIAGSSSSDVRINGTGVSLSGRNLPPLEGSSTKYQLPALLIGDDFSVINASNVTIRGMAVVWNEFEFAYGSENQTVDFRGRLLTAKFLARGRQEWDMDDVWWDLSRTLFLLQYKTLPDATTITTFPEYMRRTAGFEYNPPRLKLSPNTDNVEYRWHDWSQSVYVKGPNDTGLKWNVIRVTPL